jgi:hypothetical protein
MVDTISVFSSDWFETISLAFRLWPKLPFALCVQQPSFGCFLENLLMYAQLEAD